MRVDYSNGSEFVAIIDIDDCELCLTHKMKMELLTSFMKRLAKERTN